MLRQIFGETRENWAELNLYQRFEQIVVLLLSAVISVVILVAAFNLLQRVLELLRLGLLDPSRPDIFQSVFGMIMIVLISLEFNHTILGLLDRGRSIVQVRAVVLIALLAVLRKFIVIEIGETDAVLLLALSASTLALGGVYWAVREQDRAMRRAESGGGQMSVTHAQA
jgi:uncharacterized membrane protein (DUF373 family)